MAALHIGELPRLYVSDPEIQEKREWLKQAGIDFFRCLARRGVSTETIHQVNLAFTSVMTLMTDCVNSDFPAPDPQNQVITSTRADFGVPVNFDDSSSVINPPENAVVVAGGIPDSEVTVVFDNFNQRRRYMHTILQNMALVNDYAELETEIRNQIMEWTTTVKAVASLITKDHKTAIADYVCSNWIRRRQCVSVEIFKGRDIWVPLVDAVFRNNTLEEKNRLVEFFRKSITQYNNKFKPILMLNVSVHDRHCRCCQAPRPA